MLKKESFNELKTGWLSPSGDFLSSKQIMIGELKILRSRCDETAKDLLKKICESYYMGRTNTDDEYIHFEIYDKDEFSKYSSPVNVGIIFWI